MVSSTDTFLARHGDPVSCQVHTFAFDLVAAEGKPQVVGGGLVIAANAAAAYAMALSMAGTSDVRLRDGRPDGPHLTGASDPTAGTATAVA